MTTSVIDTPVVHVATANQAGYARFILDPVKRLGSAVGRGFSRLGSLPGASVVAGFIGKIKTWGGKAWRRGKEIVSGPLFRWNILNSLTTEGGRAALKKGYTPIVKAVSWLGRMIKAIVRAPFSWFGQAQIVDKPVAWVADKVRTGASWLHRKTARYTRTDSRVMRIANVIAGSFLIRALLSATPHYKNIVLKAMFHLGKWVALAGTAAEIVRSLAHLVGQGNRLESFLQAQMDRLDRPVTLESNREEMTEIQAKRAEVDAALADLQSRPDAATGPVQKQIAQLRTKRNDVNRRFLKRQEIENELAVMESMTPLIYAIHVREHSPDVKRMDEVMSGNQARKYLDEWGQATRKVGSLLVDENEVYLARLALVGTSEDPALKVLRGE